MPEIYTDGLVSNRIYLSGEDGILRTVEYNGFEKWSFTTSPVSPIKSAPIVREESGSVYLYFATENGDIYKLKDNGLSYTQQWKINVSANIKNNIIDTETKLYIATQNNKIYCLNKIDGNICSGWNFDSGIDSPISGTMALDDRADVNTGWIGLENGKVIAFNLGTGLISNQFTTGGAIYSSPYVDTAYSRASNNLYMTSSDAKLYSRTASNLTTYPPYWNDYSALSPIKTSPALNFESDPNKYVFFGDDSGRLYKVSASSGTLADKGWIYQADSPIINSPIVWDYVYFSAGNCIYALDVNTGELRNGFPVCTGATIRGDFVLDLGNNVLIFSSDDGKTYMIQL